MADGFEKFLRFGEGRRLKRLAEQAAYIATLEPDFRGLSDEQLRAKTVEFRERLANGEDLNDLLFEAFAAVREARLRESDQRIFDVQMMGGIVLHEGDVAEMKTGEGKTFVASLALYLNALPTVEQHDGRILGQGVHLVTVNDYLAQRDAEWNRGVYERLGMTVAHIETMMPFEERKLAYEADITYGTNSEFGFDYLRDNMAVSLEGAVQRGHRYAIVDEVDSILIDEARTPLIISGEPIGGGEGLHRHGAHRAHAARHPVQGHEGRGRGAAARVRLPLRREAQDGLRHRAGDREGRARAPDREPLRARERPARQPPDAGAEGGGALQARRRLRRPGRRGEDRRRVHRPDHGGPPLVGRPPPGGRGEGGRPDPGGAPDARHDHPPELLPPLQAEEAEARRHDRHREDRGEGVRRDLRPRGRPDPDQRRRRP